MTWCRFRPSPLFFALALALILPLTAFAFDEDFNKKKTELPPNFKYRTVTTKDGLHFRVPEDMPVVERGGIQMALPFDEYVYGKFGKFEARVARLEAKVKALEAKR